MDSDVSRKRVIASQFAKLRVQYNEPRCGIDMWVAVWINHGRGEVCIGAPTLQQLSKHWRAVTGVALDVERAQHVIVTDFTALHPVDCLQKGNQRALAAFDESADGAVDCS